MKQVLITGITGFVGLNLQEYLSKNYKLLGVSRTSNQTLNIKSYAELSVDDLNQSEAIIHLAGKAHDLRNVSNEQEYFTVNTDLTKDLFDKFLESSCKTFVYMSSIKAVSDSPQSILDESATPEPKTAYGKSKLAAEQYLQQNSTKEKSVYILRPCMIHGPKNKGNLNLLHKIIQKNIPYPLGAYENKRSFLTVANLCFIIHELLTHNITSGVYHLSDDQSISTKDLVRIIAEQIGKKPKIINFPKFIILIIAKFGNFLKLPLNTNRLDKLTESYEVSNEKIKKAIKKELPFTTVEGLKNTIASFDND